MKQTKHILVNREHRYELLSGSRCGNSSGPALRVQCTQTHRKATHTPQNLPSSMNTRIITSKIRPIRRETRPSPSKPAGFPANTLCKYLVFLSNQKIFAATHPANTQYSCQIPAGLLQTHPGSTKYSCQNPCEYLVFLSKTSRDPCKHTQPILPEYTPFKKI